MYLFHFTTIDQIMQFTQIFGTNVRLSVLVEHMNDFMS